MGIVIEIPKSTVDRLLRAAIQQRRMIRLRYDGKDRILEPHDYGIQNGCLRLLAYQVAGASNHKLPNWRCMDADKISEPELLNQTFPGGRPTATGKHGHWDHLIARVAPREK